MDLNCPICGTAIQPCCAATVAANMQLEAPQAAPQSNVAGKVLTSKPRTKSKPLYENDKEFLRFWEVYPLKRGKITAYRKWRAAVEQVEPQVIIDAALRYSSDPGRDPEHTKWPEGWLNAGRWMDEYEVARPETKTIVKTQEEIDAEWERQRAEDDARIASMIAEDS